MEIRQIIDTYNEKLLVLQYDVTEVIEHRLTKGEVREQLIEQLIRGELENVNIKNGILVYKDWQSSQADCIVLKKNARAGVTHMYDVSDCTLFMEIKSCSTRGEYEALQEHARQLKEREPDILVGMFSYSSSAKRETVVPQFGFKYDRGLQTFKAYEKTADKYPDIDFYYNLNIQKNSNLDEKDSPVEVPYCIVKDSEGIKNLFVQPPVISNLINVFRGTIE